MKGAFAVSLLAACVSVITLPMTGSTAVPVGKKETGAEHGGLGVTPVLRWVRVDPAAFTMGARPGPDCLAPSRQVVAENEHKKAVYVDVYQGPHWDEQPVHQVTITSAYELSVRRVTLDEFVRYKPEHRQLYESRSMAWDPNAPATMVTWEEAMGYCRWLGRADNATCRLPTEAEWEHAAGNAEALGVEGVGDGVQEWCLDWWSPYTTEAETDSIGPADGVVRVIRGRKDRLGRSRVSDRSGSLPEERMPSVSFRVARVNGSKGTHRAARPPETAFRNVVQSVKTWKKQENPHKPVFHGGQVYIEKKQEDAIDLPYWGRHHVPSIAWCDNGDVLATCMTSPNDGSDQMAVLITRLRSGTDAWDSPARFFILPDQDVDSAILHRADNGELHHYNYLGHGEGREFTAARRFSRDNGATWSKPAIVRFHPYADEPDKDFPGELRYLHLDLIQLENGAMVMARDIKLHRLRGTVLFQSTNNGMNWREMTRLGWQAADYGRKGKQAGWIAGWHAPLAVLKDGSYMAIGRSCDIDGHSPLSRSSDRGRTWTYLPSDFSPISSGQRPVIKRLAEGPLMIVHYTDSSDTFKDKQEKGLEITDAAGKRRRVYGSFTALSFDEGVSWNHHKLLPDDAKKPHISKGSGYYSAVQTPDGMIHLINSLRYYRFNLAWLKEPMPAEE